MSFNTLKFSLLKISTFSKLLGVSLALTSLGSSLISASAFAATSSSWQSQPSWASGGSSEGSSNSSNRKSSYKESRSNVSPFSPGSNNVALDLGQVFLMGDLTQYSDSIGAQLHYTYGVSDMFGFDSSIGYSSHSDGKYSMGTLLTGLRTNLAWYDRIVPYLVFGLGFYRPSFEVDDPIRGGTSSISPLLFGVHLGPGVDLQLTQSLFFGAALTFHDVFGTEKKTADNKPIDVGGTFTSFFIHAGVTF